MGEALARARPVGLAALAVAAVLGLTACSGPSRPTDGSSPIGGGSGGTPTVSAPTTAAKPTAQPTVERTEDDLRDCVADTWRLRAISSTPGGAVEQVSFGGKGAFDMAFSDAGRWRLVDRPGAPLTATFEIAGFPVTGTAAVDGTATGRYRLVDTVGVFRLEKTAGQVDMRWPTGEQTYGMDALAGALVPDGTAALRCSADRLTLEAENVTLSLTRR